MLRMAVFLIVQASGILEIGGLLATLKWPELRVWPPPRRRSWQFWFIWSLAAVYIVGITAIGILDWGTLGLRHWSRLFVGGPLVAVGTWLGLWGVLTLGSHQSLGLAGQLVTSGPYRYTRNPQYLGDILLLAGLILITNSLLFLVAALMGILWFALAPLAEEPWLRDQYGGSYVEYCEAVPRFLGRNSFRRRSKLPEGR
jgi:protein-S-isoprenylcysteine O-methyltransferase Ste14